MFLPRTSLAAAALLACLSHADPPDPPTLELAGSRIIHVANEVALQSAMDNLQSGDTLLLANGAYHLTRSLYIKNRDNITIRGDSGDTNVVLVGKGMDNAKYGETPFGIWSSGVRTTIAHLTIRDTYDNEIIFNPGAQSPHIYSVRLVNSGSQFIKSNPTDVNAGRGVDHGLVEYCSFEYTGQPPADHGSGIGYFNGISAHAAKNWIVRKNIFKNLHNPDGTAYSWNPAVLFWRNSSNTLTEQNVFINVDRAIAYGLDDSIPYRDHSGGIVRNNFVYLSPGFFSPSRKASSDGSIIAWNSPGTQVDHNTLLLNQNTFFAIEFRFAHITNAAARNNLSDAPIHLRDNAKGSISGNITTATPALFVNPSAADLHLLRAPASTLQHAPPVNTVTNDIDGDPRARDGTQVDVGADQLSLVAPAILNLRLTDFASLLTFTSVTNFIYRLERTADLNRPWTVAQNSIPGTGRSIEILDSAPAVEPRQFYRVKASP